MLALIVFLGVAEGGNVVVGNGNRTINALSMTLQVQSQ